MLIGQVSDNLRLEVEKIVEDKLRAYRSYVGKVMSVSETEGTKGIIQVYCPDLDGTNETDGTYWPAKPASWFNYLTPEIGDSVEVRFPFGGDGSTLEYYAKFYDGEYIHSGIGKKVLFEVDKSKKVMIYYDKNESKLIIEMDGNNIQISSDEIKLKKGNTSITLDGSNILLSNGLQTSNYFLHTHMVNSIGSPTGSVL